LGRTRSSQGFANAALYRRDWQSARMIPKDHAQSCEFNAIERNASVRRSTDEINVVRSRARPAQSRMHSSHQRADRKGGVSPLGAIKCAGTTFDFSQYFRTSSFGRTKILEYEETSSLGEGEPVPAPIERNRAFRSGVVVAQRSSSLETNKRFKRELVYATG
jgi:hypothetical protein